MNEYRIFVYEMSQLVRVTDGPMSSVFVKEDHAWKAIKDYGYPGESYAVISFWRAR